MEKERLSVGSPWVIGSLLLTLLCGYFLGRIVDSHLQTEGDSFTVVPEINPGVPVVEIDGIENGMLRGSIRGEARLFIGDAAVLPSEDGTFRESANVLLRDIISVKVPEGTRFVASRRGRKYYAIGSSGADAIAVENRVYFQTEEEAEKAGYVR